MWDLYNNNFGRKNMRIKIWIVIILTMIITNKPVMAISYENMHTGTFTVFTPHFAHIANVTSEESGFMMAYKYYGYLSIIGQLDFIYTTEKENSFSFSIGSPYLMAGGNIKIINYNQGKIFLNCYFGIKPDENDDSIFGNLQYLGSLGPSYKVALNNSSVLETSIDAFFHPGWNDSFFIPPYPAMRGLTVGANYAKNIISGLWINISLGLSYTEYRKYELTYVYGKTSKGYLSCSDEKSYTPRDTIDKAVFSWEPFFFIPIGIAISYKF